MSTLPLSGKVIAFEGQIGTGKSSLVKKMQEYMQENTQHGLCYASVEKGFEEPLKLFTNPATTKRFATLFQNMMLGEVQGRIEICEEVAKTTGMFAACERTETGNTAFFRLNKKSKNIDADGCTFYTTLLNKNNDRNFSIIFYLEVSPEIALKRIAGRNRDGESGYELKYLEDLDLQMFVSILKEAKKSDEESPLPFVLLDWNSFGTPEFIIQKTREILESKTRICPRFIETRVDSISFESHSFVHEEKILKIISWADSIYSPETRTLIKYAFIKGYDVHATVGPKLSDELPSQFI